MAQTIKVNGTPEADTVHSRNGDAAVRKFTWRELSKLNEPHNAHIAYRGKVSIEVTKKNGYPDSVVLRVVVLQVYDVSKFASQHPGGVDQILCAAGRDITLVFEAYHDLPKVTK